MHGLQVKHWKIHATDVRTKTTFSVETMKRKLATSERM